MNAFLSHTLTSLAVCRTPSDFYRTQIDILENATPAEVAMLMRTPIGAPAEFDNWLRSVWEMMTSERAEIQPFQRNRLSSNILHYRGASRASTLVIGFCGKAGLLFMPIPAILQFFRADEFDVLVLRDPAKMGFVRGIADYADSFPKMIERVRREVNVAAYQEVRTFGTSGGGGAALAGGVLLEARHAACFCGHLPSSSSGYGAHGGSATMEAIMRGSILPAGYHAVFGDANQKDTRNAQALNQALGVRLRPVPGVSDHNVILELHDEQAVTALFKEVGLV